MIHIHFFFVSDPETSYSLCSSKLSFDSFYSGMVRMTCGFSICSLAGCVQDDKIYSLFVKDVAKVVSVCDIL